MRRRLLGVSILGLLLAAATGGAADRLAVLEFFGRPSGTYCSAAGPAMIALQDELAGTALLLEYHFDWFHDGRYERFAAAEPHATTLPLVMVGSGSETSWGPVEYERDYRAMLTHELARAPQAELAAWWWHSGASVTVEARLVNRAGITLGPATEATVWVVVWEDSTQGVGRTWVRAVGERPLTTTLANGAATELSLSLSVGGIADWSAAHAVVLVDRYRSELHRYDMLQAAVAAPAGVQVTPAVVALTSLAPRVELAFDAPPSAHWQVAEMPPWLELDPAAGEGSATVVAAVDHGRASGLVLEGTLRLVVTGVGAEQAVEVPVSFRGGVRRAPRRVAPAP